MIAEVRKNYWLLAVLAAGCLVVTLLSGITAGVILALPNVFGSEWTIHTLRPVHVALAVTWLFTGAQAFTGLYLARDDRASLHLSRLILVLQAGFLAGLAVSFSMGRFSGREYLAWPPLLSIPLALAMLGSAADIMMNFRRLRDHSPEAAWFLLLGFILLPAGLIENQLYLLDRIVLNPGRDLVVQWHSLDMVIAAWSLMLYAVGMLMLPPLTKKLRSTGLFILAAVGILLDFGHHSYPSPQAHAVKLISFSATMLAVVSFVRHVRAARREHGLAGYPAWLGHIEWWILFAVGTGILMAVPWINYYVHGTYFVVGHTMGSIIGVNTLLVFAGLYHLTGRAPGRRTRLLTVMEINLVLFIVVFSGLGLAKGWLRQHYDFLEWSLRVKPYYIAIPVIGLPLTLILLWFGLDLARCAWRQIRPAGRDAGTAA